MMTKPEPMILDDEDPFADTFAGFEAPQEESSPSEETDAEAFAADAAADAPGADAEPEPSRDATAAAPGAEETPFDWFANFPKAEPGPAEDASAAEAPASAPASSGERRKSRFPWRSPGAKSAAAKSAGATAAAFDPEPPAAIADPETAAFDAALPEPETVESAPSVPAAFDDAVTEPEAFEPAPVSAQGREAEPSPFAVAESFVPSAPAPNPVAEMIATAEAALGEAVVPRIAIHVFAQHAETAAVAQTAAADRRLQRASTAVRPGGLPEALALYASSPTPALVIVENTAPAAQLLADLERLAEVCDPGTKVVVIGQANDIGLYRELMRRGVSEYLVPPLNPLQLIRTIGGLYSDPATPFVGRTLAFTGVKGGVGSSTIAHNIAWCLSERIQAQACVVDYDLAFGTAGLDFNQDPVQGLHDALAKPDRLDATLIDRMLSRCTERLSLLAAPATLDDDYDIPADVYEDVAAKIRSTAPFMVLDLPHAWSTWMRKTLLSADEVVLVAQPDLASLRNAKNMIELIAKARPNDAPPKLVLNQVGLPGRPEIPLKDFGKALGFEPTLVVPFDAKLFGAAANNGQMVGEVNEKAKASEALLNFAQAITRREAAPAKPRSLVERLLKGG